MIVSPRKSCSVSIVAGLRVATVSRSQHSSGVQAKGLTRVVIRGGFIYDEAMGATKTVSEVLLVCDERELHTISLSAR